jgi:hypothetical protein
MTRIDALLNSPRATAVLVALVAGQDDRWGATRDADLVTELGGRIAAGRLADADALAAVATDAVRDWRWRDDVDPSELSALAVALSPAAQQLVAAPAADWWWQPLARDRQIWIAPPEQAPGAHQAVFDPTEWGAWPTKPRRALWTTTLVASVPAALFADWDGALKPPLTLWRLPVMPTARVYEIGTADDWRALCAAYPKDTTDTYSHYFHEWHVPGRRIVTPDWAAVAGEWDGVHLSLAGLLLAEATPLPLDAHSGTSLEGWGCEMTQWFRWMFDEPEPAGQWTSSIPA